MVVGKRSWDELVVEKGHGKGKSAVETLKRNEWKDEGGRNPVNAEIGLNPDCFAAIQVNSRSRGSLSRKLIIRQTR